MYRYCRKTQDGEIVYKAEETAYFKKEGVFYSEKHNEFIIKENGKLDGKMFVVIGLQHSMLSDYNLWDFVYVGEL